MNIDEGTRQQLIGHLEVVGHILNRADVLLHGEAAPNGNVDALLTDAQSAIAAALVVLDGLARQR